MNITSSKFWIVSAVAVLAIALTVNLNWIASGLDLPTTDLTEDERFTLPEAARSIAAEIEDDLHVKVYLSSSMPSYLTGLNEVLVTRLEEFARASKGRFTYELIDPDDRGEEFQEGLAEQGIVPVTARDQSEGKQVDGAYFMTLVFSYADQDESVNLAGLGRAVLIDPPTLSSVLPFLISSQILKLKSEEATLGIVAKTYTIPPQQRGQQPREGDVLARLRAQLGSQLRNVTDVNLEGGAPVPDAITTLVLHRPEELSERQVFALDQYLMRGGRIVLLLDREATFEHGRERDRINQSRQIMVQPKLRRVALGEPLEEWLAHFGVEVAPGYLASEQSAREVLAYQRWEPRADGRFAQRRVEVTRLLPTQIHALEKEEDDEEQRTGQVDALSPFFLGLGRLGFLTAAPLQLDAAALTGGAGEGLEHRVLVRTGENTWIEQPSSGQRFAFYQDSQESDTKLSPGASPQSYPLIVSVQGAMRSAWAGREAPGSEESGDTEAGGDEGESGRPKTPVVEASEEAGQLVLIADSDFVDDLALQVLAQSGAQKGALDLLRTQGGVSSMLAGLVLGDDRLSDVRRPLIRDRSLDAEEREESKGEIRLLTIVLPLAILLAIGLLHWAVRTLTSRAAPQAAATRSETQS